MGCGGSTPATEEDRLAAQASKAIEKDIAREAREQNTLIKALLLGTGASGKSTICKQMRLIFLNGYSAKDAMSFRAPIVLNTMRNMVQIVEQAGKWGIGFTADNTSSATRLTGMQIGPGMELDKETAEMLLALWQDEAAQAVMARANETSIDDAHPYFMDNLMRIADADYVPSVDDILRCRVKTLGIHETHFHSPNALDFTLVDVGGQRTERRKWIHCFSEVTLVLFVVALSEYDQGCEEDPSTNRLVESLGLFDDIVNNKFFSHTDVCIFYNKDDLFRSKVEVHPFASFHSYSGPSTADAVRKHIKGLFDVRNRSDPKMRSIYTHVTCATDTAQIRVVWMSVADVLLRGNLADAGFAQELL